MGTKVQKTQCRVVVTVSKSRKKATSVTTIHSKAVCTIKKKGRKKKAFSFSSKSQGISCLIYLFIYFNSHFTKAELLTTEYINDQNSFVFWTFLNVKETT